MEWYSEPRFGQERIVAREPALGLACVWTVRERPAGRDDLPWRTALRKRNLFTNFGLSGLASALGGSAGNYMAPQYVALDTKAGLIQNTGGLAVGATSVSLDVDPTLAGDTSLVLGVGTANQETTAFSAKTGTGPYVFTIAATTKTHAQNDPCSRAPLAADTVALFTSEGQYDSVVFPNQRLQSIGGYSQGTGNWVVQFFFTGSQAIFTFVRVGLTDSVTLGAGNLHNELALGYVHASGNDVELDVSLTLTNN